METLDKEIAHDERESSFNSATDLGPWKRGRFGCSPDGLVGGFNSATDLGPWKLCGFVFLTGF